MKKCIMSVLAAAAALFVTSCAKDAQVAEVTVADATVTFGVTAPELGSRAFGEGAYARKLTVLVYDKNGYREDLKVETPMGGLTEQVTVTKLVKGEKYSFLFWAQSADATCFTLDAANGKVAIDYATAMNNEKVDAFFAQELDMVAKANAAAKTVVLKRPFAQINLGTNDMDAFAANAFAAATSTLTIKHVYNTLDLHDGSVAGVGAVTIPAATIPAVGTKFKVGTADEYNYLALNYVLVEADKALVEVEYAIDNIAGIDAAKTVALQNIPVQRNYRTNLYGSLFTTSATFNVEILPGFVDEFNNGTSTFNMEGVERIGVNEYNILNATGLVNASSQLFAKGGTFNITPDGTRAEGDTDVIDMTGMTYEAQTITNVAGSITINGNGKTIKGLGNQLIATTGSAKSITVKDLTLDGSIIDIADDGANGIAAFIGYAGTSEVITIDNCHIVNANIKGGHWTGGFVGYAAGYNAANNGPVFETLTISNCSIENSTIESGDASVGSVLGHATGDLATLVKVNGIVAKNNVVKNAKEDKAGTLVGTIGVAGKEAAWNGKMGGLYIDNFTAKDNKVNGANYNGEKKLYGRVGSGGKLFLNGGEVTAIEALFSNDENIYVKLTDKRTALEVSDAYLSLGGADTKTITIEGATGAEEFYLTTSYWGRIITVNPEATVTFKNCVLNRDLYNSTPWDQHDIVFYNTNAVLENVVINNALAIDKANATLKNVTINEQNVGAYALWITATSGTVKMENCNINAFHKDGRAIKISDQYVAEADRKAVVLEINGGKFVANSKPAIYVGNTAGANVTVKNLDITGIKTGVMIARDTESTYANAPIYYNGNLLDAVATVNGKGYMSLGEAIKDAKNSEYPITLEKNKIYADQISGVENVTIIGAEDGSSVWNFDTKDSKGNVFNPYNWKNVVVKNVSFEWGNYNYHGFPGSGDLTFENCTFNGRTNGYGTHEVYKNCTFNQTEYDYCMWTYGGNIDYIGCTFNGKNKFIHCYKEGGAGEGKTIFKINVKDCKFVATSTCFYGAVYVKAGDINVDVDIDNCTLEGNFTNTNGGFWTSKGNYNEYISIKVNGVEGYKK